MLGDIVQLADNLWLVVGDLPPDIPNSIVYHHPSDRLYLMDSGAGATIRASIMQVLQQRVGRVQSFTLLNSHGHADHVGNNDLIHTVQAKETYHYLSEAGLGLLDPVRYFADQFYKLSDIYDPGTGFQAHRLRWWLLRMLRDILALFVGERRALEIIFSIYLMRFQPFHPSLETIQTYESLSNQPLNIGGVSFNGWVLGKNDVWVLESRGHTPDEVLFYLPEHKLLYTGDLTVPLFPTFPDSDGAATRDMLQRCKAIASSGAMSLLIDGHHHQVYRGKEEVTKFLETLLTEQEHFQALLRKIIEEHDGLTVAQVYKYIRQCHDDPVVQHYLSLEYPHLPMSLQQIIAVSLIEMGYETKGPRRKKCFYPIARVA